MSVQIKYPGFSFNAAIDATKLTGDNEADVKSEYIQGLKAGRLVALSETGVKLADPGDSILGVLKSDAAGQPWDNRPALASGLIAVEVGNCGFETDQLAAGETWAQGAKLYVGAGAKSGLVTSNKPVVDSEAGFIGIAEFARSASDTVASVVRV